MLLKKSEKSSLSFAKLPLPPNQSIWLLILLTLTIVAPSLMALTFPSCGEGSLSLKGWGLEYQLTKKGGCSPPE